MDITFVKDYVKHRLTAKRSGSYSSLFVQQLLNSVIYDNTDNQLYQNIETSKRGYLPTSRRKGNRPKADQLLFRLAKYFNPVKVVEIGTGRGISKLYLNRALPNTKVVSLEHDGGLKHAANKLKNIDFVFINYYNPAELLSCFELLLPKFNTDSVLVICNVYGDSQAKQNFQMIKTHPRVTATVDLFWLQLVFFKPEIHKEHFRLRF